MSVFVTVGTTKFDALVSAVDNARCRALLRRLGHESMTVQIGHGSVVPRESNVSAATPSLRHFRHEPSLAPHIAAASLVISHGGAGTIMEVLRARKPLIVVVNDKLMGNHQTELAEALQQRGHLVVTSPDSLLKTLECYDATSIVPYGKADAAKFALMVGQELGFED